MLDLDDINKAVNYPPASLDSLSSNQLDRLSFVGYPDCHGYDHIDLLFPKKDKFGKLDPPASYLSSGGSHEIKPETTAPWRALDTLADTNYLDDTTIKSR